MHFVDCFIELSAGQNSNSVLLQYLLLTDNDEKVPNTAACPSGVTDPQCSPGYARHY